MISSFRTRVRMNRMYRSPKDSIYMSKFFDELCTGYSFYFGEEGEEDFYTVEPPDCKLSKRIFKQYHYDLSYRIEKVIDQVTYNLVAYGKAFVLIQPKYSLEKYCSNESIELPSIDISAVDGFIKKKDKINYVFCIRGYNGITRDIEIQRKQLIMFDIKELGYNKKHFANILKKLEKCDITAVSTSMLTNDSNGYDYEVHSRIFKLKELRATKDIGWMFGVDELSDSYILYKKIKADKLRMQFLQYILEKLNSGLCDFIGDSGGKIVAHVIEKNYDQLWKDYSDGKMTGTELRNILYHNLESSNNDVD